MATHSKMMEDENSYKDLGKMLPPGGFEHQGASGATARSDSMRTGGGRGRRWQTTAGQPEEDNASSVRNSQTPSTRTVTTRSVSRRENPILSETTLAGKARIRMKWTQEINMYIMRTYYHITRLETDTTAFRKKLHEAFTRQYPNIPITEQHVADQRRAIVKNKYLSDESLDQIKREVQEILDRENNTATEQNNEANETNDNIPNVNQEPLIWKYLGQESSSGLTNNLNETEGETPEQATENTELSQQPPEYERANYLKNLLTTNLQKYSGMDPTRRPRIPKQKTSRKFAKTVDILNKQILPTLLDVETFSELHDLIYSSAVTAAIANGAKIIEFSETKRNKERRKPAWEERLVRKIEQKRIEIARLREYKSSNNPSNKLRNNVSEIFKKYRIHTPRDLPNSVNSDFLDTLQQKLTALSARLRRYRNCRKRKSQNNEFRINEKKFYRTLKESPKEGTEEDLKNLPSREQITTYWSSIWQQNTYCSLDNNWTQKEEDENAEIMEMEEPIITPTLLSDVIASTHSWKSPGSDQIHNFWYKKLTSTHTKLAEFINKFVKTPETVPEFLTEGKTYLLPKGKTCQDPSKYRPITCLQTIYKILTSCITKLISKHVEDHQIMTEEQKGCRKGSKGCKEQLIIDAIILNEVKKKKRKLSCCYVDYQKAYDSVPHLWLVKVLKIYKIHPKIIKFLHHLMQNWRTVVQLSINSLTISTPEIRIKRGIFQGDSLSPLWFCLALNPLSKMLNRTGIGYTFKQAEVEHTVSHQLYMDDLKLYAKNHDKLKELISLVKKFSEDICMTFGLDKCRVINIDRGKCQIGDVQLSDGGLIEAMNENETYKYLGYQQAKTVEHTKIKQALSKEYTNRVDKICRTELNSRNLFKALNTLAIPVLTYSFGIITWTETDLEGIMRKTRTILTKHRKHHPKASTIRMTLPRGEGGRGLTDIKNLHNNQIKTLRSYFHKKSRTSNLHMSACLSDRAHTPLNLAYETVQPNETITSREEKHQEWRSKVLHGRHPHDLDQNYVDKQASNEWLKCGELYPETEGFMVAIQDQVVNTRNYLKYIVKEPTVEDDRCRKCFEKPETIQHITSGCSFMSQNEYLHRHNQVSAIIHQDLCCKLGLKEETPKTPYYKYEPLPVIETRQVTIYHDRSIITDRKVTHNKPDIVVRNKIAKEAYIIDIAIPNTHNLMQTIAEKKRKYTELSDEIKKMWTVDKVFIVPIVISATGVIPKDLQRSLETLGLQSNIYKLLQKAVVLNTTRIVRRFLSQQ